jgi:zinc transporter
MSENHGLVSAHLLDGRGGGKLLSWNELASWHPEQGTLWVHLNRAVPEARRWVTQDAGLDRLVSEALLEEETRPRHFVSGEGLLVILRGVNLNPGAEPEDMVSLRLWFEPRRIITLRARKVMATQDMREALGGGTGPQSPGDFLGEIAGRLIERMGAAMHTLDDELDGIEEHIVDSPSADLRTRLADLRRQTIAMRRYIAPQREVLARLPTEPLAWIEERHRIRLREELDGVTRVVEDLDSLRERASVTRDELSSRLSEEMNNRMYLLSIVAAVFLPLGLLTGLLGINVGGMPGVGDRWAFTIVCIILIGLGGVMVTVLHRLRWF